MRWTRAALALALTSASGCGLALDYGPPSPDAQGVNRIDAHVVEIDVGVDREDAAIVRDGGMDAANVTGDASVGADGSSGFIDGSLSRDVGGTRTEAGTGSADGATTTTDAATIDAALVDSSLIDASTFMCLGVHPIIGPPRTCDPGSCLCLLTDNCFTTDSVAFCCTTTFACAPARSDCMATHPIIGPPRTCNSGDCYCANPDACFPADRAAGCCAVPVNCVP